MNRELKAMGRMIRPIGLGAMPLSISGRPAESQAFDVLEAFVEGGGDFIDTANVYCLNDSEIGHNERLIHRGLTRIGKRDAVLVATKGGMRRPRGAWKVDANPKWLRTSCEKSLKDLGSDAIAMYQLHAPDLTMKFGDSLGELIRLKEEGKILHIGLSNVELKQLVFALRHTTIASVQNRCNPFSKQDFDNGLIRMCQSKDIAYIAYSPMGGHHGHLRMRAHPLFQRLSQKYGASPYCVVLAWLLRKGEHIIPIPGASRISSVRDATRALGIKLEPGDIAQIDRLPDN